MWLESIIQARLPDVDLSAGPPGIPTDGPNGDSDQNVSPLQEGRPNHHTVALPDVSQSLNAPDQRAHEIGLISVGAKADQKYIGPSSGYFLARLLLACSPRVDTDDAHISTVDTPTSRSLMNDLVDVMHGPFPLPAQPLAVRLSRIYFDTIQPQWPILHEPSFRAAMDQLLLDQHTLTAPQTGDPHVHFQVYMVLAISAKILSYRTKRPFSGESYCLSALQYLDQLKIQSSIQGLQCMLLLLIFAVHSPHTRLNVWYLNYQCLATVLDLGLQRNITASAGVSHLNQEMRTRLFWTVFTLDRTIATMMGRPIGLRDEACELRVSTVRNVLLCIRCLLSIATQECH